MMKNLKMGFIYLISIVLAVVIMLMVNFADRYELSPKNVYKVYLDGKVIGNIKNKKDLEDYINSEQQELKEKYKVNKVYIPTGVDIQKCTTYEKKVLSAKQVHNIIKKEKPFTVKGYKVTINPYENAASDNDETDEKIKKEKIVINVLNKDMLDKAIKSVVKAFVSEKDYNNFKNDSQEEIKDTGSLIEDIYIAQNITMKESYISTDEDIFNDEKVLTKYLMFGELKDDQYYTVQEGDTIESISYANKLATSEFLIVNPEFTSANNLLSPGQQVKVGLINTVIDVIVEKHEVFDQESQFKTTEENDDTLDYGTKKVVTEGQNGTDRLTTKIKYDNGATANIVIVSTETITPSVNKVVKVGTKQTSGNYSIVATAGDWAWPTVSPYYISSPFAYRWGRLHQGIDIAGSGSGSPIYAVGAGTVESSNSAWSLGNNIIINHGNGYWTLYAHLNSKLVSPGQTVQKGQQIATMGSTGRSTGTHLHLGLWVGGAPYKGTCTDPMILFK